MMAEHTNPPAPSTEQPAGPSAASWTPPVATTTVWPSSAFAGPQTGGSVITNITVAAPSPTVVVVNQATGPGLLVRALYFLFIGLWLGFVCTELAWLLNLTIIGLPLGLLILNRLSQIMTLKLTTAGLQVSVQNGVVVVQQGHRVLQPFLLRALYFLLIGWWLSLIWLNLAWALAGFTLGLGLSLSFWMFNRAPAVTTLRR
jgi:uncharacterized membrane protein YccF (DUF307 family)